VVIILHNFNEKFLRIDLFVQFSFGYLSLFFLIQLLSVDRRQQREDNSLEEREKERESGRE
jgi:hypothetical protein